MISAAPISENELRQLLLARLRPECEASGSLLVQEMEISGRSARIDVAVIGDHLHGYEIKSDRDSLARMAGQIHSYNRVFDEVTLVTGPVLAAPALRIAPSWWGVAIAARTSSTELSWTLARAPAPNSLQDVSSVVALLWKEELYRALTRAGVDTLPRNASRRTLFDSLMDAVEFNVLRAWAVETLKTRSAWKPT